LARLGKTIRAAGQRCVRRDAYGSLLDNSSRGSPPARPRPWWQFCWPDAMRVRCGLVGGRSPRAGFAFLSPATGLSGFHPVRRSAGRQTRSAACDPKPTSQRPRM